LYGRRLVDQLLSPSTALWAWPACCRWPPLAGFEHARRGTLSLYAALNTQTGQVMGSTVDGHASGEFVASLGGVVASRSPKEIHIILDNLFAHKTKRVKGVSGHPR